VSASPIRSNNTVDNGMHDSFVLPRENGDYITPQYRDKYSTKIIFNAGACGLFVAGLLLFLSDGKK